MLGPVVLSGLNEGKRDLSRQKWTYQARMINFVSLIVKFIHMHIILSNKYFLLFRLVSKEKT